MKDNLNWNLFSEEYHLKNDKYVRDITLLKRLQCSDDYPIILYPDLLREQMAKKFVIGSFGAGKDQSHIFLHDFLNTAKQLNIKGDDWQFLIHPFNPEDAAVPQIPHTPTEITEHYTSHNWGCLIPVIIVAILFTLPTFFVSPEDPGLAVIVAILWIPFILFMGNEMNVGKPETKTRTRKLAQDEIDQLRQEALNKYKKDLESYQKLRAEYDGKMKEFNQRLDSQAKLLDNHSNLIVASIFKSCLANPLKIQTINESPQRGFSENNLFYALMKEYPSYIKIDTIVGPYYPDLVLFNGHSCPIDIEIDEPYDFQTKKEIHYIGCADEGRNKFFVQNNWFVLRFSENQIINHLAECVDIIKAFCKFIEEGDTSNLYNAEETIVKIHESRWTKEQSRMFAIESYRPKLR